MQAYGQTDTGCVRTRNQDYIYFSPEQTGDLENLFFLADGMGGYQAGDYASWYAVEELVRYMKEQKGVPLVKRFQEGITQVNSRLFQKAQNSFEYRGMGTTLVAASAQEQIMYVANVGDSRLYLFHGQKLSQVTKDHSYVEVLVAKGELERGSKDYQKQKNIITRAVGAEPFVQADFFEVELHEKDLVLMCSDGLSNMVPDEEIEEILTISGSLKEKAEQLIQRAKDHGGLDNIAVILIDPQISEVKAC